MTWGDGRSSKYVSYMAVDVGCWGETQHRKAAVRSSGLIMMQIYKIFAIKTRLSVAATNEIKKWYQQKWIFGSLSVFFSTFLIQIINYEFI